MNSTFLHLLIVYLPIFGSFLGGLALAYGLLVKSYHTKLSAYLLLTVSSVGGYVGYFTGKAAEKTVKKMQDIPEFIIEQHQEFAKFTLIALIGLGFISFTGLILSRKSSLSKGVAYLALFVSLLCFLFAGWTGYLGVRIRHIEVEAPLTAVPIEQVE